MSVLVNVYFGSLEKSFSVIPDSLGKTLAMSKLARSYNSYMIRPTVLHSKSRYSTSMFHNKPRLY